MSLKGFHIIFVMATVSLAIFFGIWAFRQYQMNDSIGYLVTTICSFLAAIGFVLYGIAFSKKVKV